jgi:hypothetical protein
MAKAQEAEALKNKQADLKSNSIKGQ